MASTFKVFSAKAVGLAAVAASALCVAGAARAAVVGTFSNGATGTIFSSATGITLNSSSIAFAVGERGTSPVVRGVTFAAVGTVGQVVAAATVPTVNGGVTYTDTTERDQSDYVKANQSYTSAGFVGTDAAALDRVVESFKYYYDPTGNTNNDFTSTFTGLTAGTTYNLQLLYQEPNPGYVTGGRIFGITDTTNPLNAKVIVAGLDVGASGATAGSGNGVDISYNFAPSATGSEVLSFTYSAGGPFISGVILTPTPEPTTLGLLGLGGLGLLAKKRRKVA